MKQDENPRNYELLANFYSIHDCDIGEGTVVRDFVNLYGCRIGKECKIAAFAEIQRGVVLGDRCKIEAYAFIPSGVVIEDEVFVGPHAVFTNDLHPHAVGDWEIDTDRCPEGSFDRRWSGHSLRSDHRRGGDGRCRVRGDQGRAPTLARGR